MSKCILIIAGGRDYTPTKEQSDRFDLIADLVDEEVCGMARGVDTWGKAWAERHGIPVSKFPADWKRRGNDAGFYRNEEMACYATHLAVFNGGNGTHDMVKRMARKGKVIWDYRPRLGHCNVVNRNDGRPFDIYIGRGTKWGNPFIEGEHGSRKTVIDMYRRWILRQPELMISLHELKGKTLGCSCKPKPCHGDVLVELLKGI